MKKLSNYKKAIPKKEIGKKSVVLLITTLFILGVFIPVVNSQLGHIVENQPFEESKNNEIYPEVSVDDEINIMESTDSKIDISKTGDDSLFNKFLTYLIDRLEDILGNHPIIDRLHELFSERDINSDEDADNEIDASDMLNKHYIYSDESHDYLDPFPSGAASDLWWDANWEYRKEITINHTKVNGDFPLLNFPVLIEIIDTDLATKAQDDGDDIVFTNVTGTQLNHEIEYFDSNSGELVAWVNVTNLSSSINTTLYLYYENPNCDSQENIGGVWDSGFEMVQHLEETSGMVNDSSSNGNDGTAVGGMNQNIDGMIDGADDFDGDNDYITFGDDADFELNDLTISFWVKKDTTGEYNALVNLQAQVSGSDTAGILTRFNTDNTLSILTPVSESFVVITTSQTFTDSSGWYYLTFTKSGTTVSIYADGNLLMTDTTTFPASIDYNSIDQVRTSLGTYWIGSTSEYVCNLNGLMDEIRVSAIARDSDWINTSYINQYNPDSFYSIGIEESYISKPIISNINPNNNSRDVPLTLSQIQFTLAHPENASMDYWLETTPDIGSDAVSGVHNGTYTVDVSNLLHGTTYAWYLNVTDGSYWTNKTYTFSTEYLLMDWIYRKQIEIDHTMVSGSLTNFPVVINITEDNDLASNAQDDFDDILFTDINENWITGSPSNRLIHEIESFNNNTGNLTVWVKIPSLSSIENTSLYMYYGNPDCDSQEDKTSVWDSNYVMVQHLGELSGIAGDSTSFGNNGIASGGLDMDAVGMIDGAGDFDGTDDNITTVTIMRMLII